MQIQNITWNFWLNMEKWGWVFRPLLQIYWYKRTDNYVGDIRRISNEGDLKIHNNGFIESFHFFSLEESKKILYQYLSLIKQNIWNINLLLKRWRNDVYFVTDFTRISSYLPVHFLPYQGIRNMKLCMNVRAARF